MSHLIGSRVLYNQETWRVVSIDRGLLTIGRGLSVSTVDPDLCVSLPEPGDAPETLADRLARVWFPILGTHARERANNVACWAGDEDDPGCLFLLLLGAIQIVNRPDYGGSLTEREIARAAALGLAEILA